MQFHHHGYVTHDPLIEPAAGIGLDRPEELPDEMDVLIVGTGPAGMITAAQLAQFPDVHTRIIERRPQRLEIGQADGIQARSVETFQAFGFANRLIDEAYRITEMCFWGPDPDNPENIVRQSRPADDPHGISEFPHLIVNQARIQDHFAEFMHNSPARMKPDHGWEMLGLSRDDAQEHPVAVELRRTTGPDEGSTRTVRAKYVVGCDGAHSQVRKAIGRKPQGDQAFHAWGVMDVLAVTDFPDIRTKCAIQSSSGGNILHIPREGGYLFRMYVDLGEVSPEDAGAIRKTTVEDTIAKANAIIHPYSLDVKNVAWYSVYEVGHRVTDRFDDVDDGDERTPRVFITGDACHTHSAKAGQGMNVSMQDGFNISWKLGHVLSGLAPESLLRTYSQERQPVAQNLIDFDKEWSTLMAKKSSEFEDPAFLADFYVKTAEFPAGFMTEYDSAPLTGSAEHQQLAAGFPLGKRFKSAPVVRVADAVPLHLGHHARADGRWRIYVFADAPAVGAADSKLAGWADWMAGDAASPLRVHTPAGADPDALFDVKVVYQQAHHEFEVTSVPEVFRPKVGPYELIDQEKVFATAPQDTHESDRHLAGDIFAMREISREGAVVIVRPDQYVSAVLPLDRPELVGEHFAPLLHRV